MGTSHQEKGGFNGNMLEADRTKQRFIAGKISTMKICLMGLSCQQVNRFVSCQWVVAQETGSKCDWLLVVRLLGMFPFWRGTNLDSSTGYRHMICISSSKTWSICRGGKEGFHHSNLNFFCPQTLACIAIYRHSKSSIMKHWIHVCVCVCSCAGTVHDCVNFAWAGVFNAMPL